MLAKDSGILMTSAHKQFLRFLEQGLQDASLLAFSLLNHVLHFLEARRKIATVIVMLQKHRVLIEEIRRVSDSKFGKPSASVLAVERPVTGVLDFEPESFPQLVLFVFIGTRLA